jgi:hypothetical protein
MLRPRRAHLPPDLESLALRPEQRRQVEAIIDRHGPEVEAALGDALPRLRVVQEKVAVEIEGVLDVDQRATFHRDRARHAPPMP